MSTTIIATIFVFGLLIFVHELGHFITAKMVRMRVDEFAIGFGPKLFSHRRGETLYSLRIIPLGGFNKIAGMDPEEQQDERSFCSKPVWARMLVIVAGSTMNFVLPVLLFCLVFWTSGIETPSDKAIIGALLPDKPAVQAGILAGDRIAAVNGAAIDNWKQFVAAVQTNAGNKLTIALERNSQAHTVIVTPEYDQRSNRGIIGVTPEIIIYRPGIAEGIGIAVSHTYTIAASMLSGIGQMITGKAAADVAGPIGVAQMAGQVAQSGLIPLLQFAAFLSINLGLINLLPVPVLDGGHLVTLSLEGLRGKPLSSKSLQYVQMIGFALLMMLFLLATFKDLGRLKLF
mgnify:CR=1 FL=1